VSYLKSIYNLLMIQFPCTVLPITTLVPHQEHCHPRNGIVSQSVSITHDHALDWQDMAMKPTNAYKHIRVSFIINTVCLLHLLAIPATILREVHYKGYHRYDNVTCRCHTCDLSYIGQTGNNLEHRHKEHIRYITSNNPNLHTHSTFSTLTTQVDKWIH